jgi:hypothetical protein
MMNRHPLVRAFEDEYLRSRPPDYERNLRIFEALYEEARALGVLPPKDPLHGIDHCIALARALNALGPPRQHGVEGAEATDPAEQGE